MNNIENDRNLSKPNLAWLIVDDYDYPVTPIERTLSSTDMSNDTLELYLKRTVTQDQLPPTKVSDLFWKTFGTGVHLLREQRLKELRSTNELGILSVEKRICIMIKPKAIEELSPSAECNGGKAPLMVRTPFMLRLNHQIENENIRLINEKTFDPNLYDEDDAVYLRGKVDLIYIENKNKDSAYVEFNKVIIDDLKTTTAWNVANGKTFGNSWQTQLSVNNFLYFCYCCMTGTPILPTSGQISALIRDWKPYSMIQAHGRKLKMSEAIPGGSQFMEIPIELLSLESTYSLIRDKFILLSRAFLQPEEIPHCSPFFTGNLIKCNKYCDVRSVCPYSGK